MFEGVPNYATGAPALRLCRIRIMDVGEGLPCVHFNNPKSKEQYSQSKDDDTLPKDYGKIPISNFCPLNYLNGDERQNKFLAQVVYEVPALQADGTAHAALSKGPKQQ